LFRERVLLTGQGYVSILDEKAGGCQDVECIWLRIRTSGGFL